MKELLQKKTLQIAIAVVIALVSFFVLAGPASSVSFHEKTLADLEEKQTTVLELSAASTAASAVITLIPGDVATPIADELAGLSTHFMLVLCAIFLEKYLLTITGTVTFAVLIPLACGCFILGRLFDWKSLYSLAVKVFLFGALIFAVIPASVWVSDLIQDTYQTSIEQTIQSAQEATQSIQEDSSQQEEDQEQSGILSGIFSTVTNGVSNAVSGATEKASEMLNNFIEALAVMVITCCVIPVLVLLSFAWFARVLLEVKLPVSYSGLHSQMKNGVQSQLGRLRKVRTN